MVEWTEVGWTEITVLSWIDPKHSILYFVSNLHFNMYSNMLCYVIIHFVNKLLKFNENLLS